MSGKGFFGYAFCMLYKRAHAINVLSNVIHARTEYCSFHLNCVLVSWQNGINAHGVAVGNVETAEIKFFNVEYGIFTTCLAVHTYTLHICIACETTCIFQKRVEALIFLHLVYHWAFHLTRYSYQAVVRTNHDNIVVGKTHIACELSVENIVVYIYNCNKFVVAIHLDVSECTQIVCSACHIECMEHGCKG